MAVSQGLVAFNAAVSPTIPWFPAPVLALILLATWGVNRRWPIRIAQPASGRAYAFAVLATYAVVSFGVLVVTLLAEVGFRGLMQTALEKILPLWPMLFLIAVRNYLMHFYNPDVAGMFVRIICMNLVWGYITWRVQSLRPALVAHVVMNIAVPLLQYASEQYGPGAVPFGDFPASTLAISALCGFVALAVALYVAKGLPERV